jgi:hypothetical protein
MYAVRDRITSWNIRATIGSWKRSSVVGKRTRREHSDDTVQRAIAQLRRSTEAGSINDVIFPTLARNSVV